MNIVLIHPYITAHDTKTYLSEPLGLIYLATYIQNKFGNDAHISILDLYAMPTNKPQKKEKLYVIGMSDEQFIKSELEKLDPDLIGITCNFTAYAIDALELAAVVKNILPNVPIVIGGAHATIEAESILRNNECIDYVVRGEGEFTLEELIHAIRGDKDIAEISGLSYRAPTTVDGINLLQFKSVISNPSRKLHKNTDMLPIPDRKYIDMERYKHLNKECLWYTRKTPIATIMTSRGCPYDCVFCSTKVVWERRWRPIRLERVFEEIEMLVSNYGIREIVINDDQFMTQKNRVHEFCDYFIKRDMDLCFWYESGTSTWLVDDDILAKMRKAGFYAIRFPIETGCENTVKFINKPINLTKTNELIAKANKLGYWTSANFIIGFPEETREEINETIRYAYDSALDYAFFFIAKPNAGSDLYNVFKEKGLLDKNNGRGSDYYNCNYDTETMSSNELNEIIANASSRWFIHKLFFYLKPINFYNHMLPKLTTWGDFCYFIKTVRIMLTKKIVPIIKNSP